MEIFVVEEKRNFGIFGKVEMFVVVEEGKEIKGKGKMKRN